MNIKFFSCVKMLITSLCVLISVIAYNQVNWTYYSDKPVLSMAPETFVWGAYGQPTVIIHNDTIKMWYAVAETGEFDPVVRGRIHYAWSLDGIEWTKYPNNPVLDVGEEGEWDNAWLDTPGILWDGNEFKLYYYGDSTYYEGQDNTAIGLATSNDGINWTKHGIVLEMGEPDSWEGHHIELPSVHYIESSGLYAMLYSGMDRSNYPLAGFIQIGLALSLDGYDWFKWEENPVIQYGSYPSWNDIGSGGAAFIETDEIFELWYTGIQIVEEGYDSWDSLKVGYAVTLNGTRWIQYPGNPVLSATAGDSTVFWAIDVIWDDSDELYKMYFESEHWHYQDPINPDTTHAINAIFYATAPRTVLFSPDCDISISDDITIEQGQNVQLEAIGGDLYTWDPPEMLNNPDISNPIATPEETTTYRVLIVSETCITKAEVTVTVEESSFAENTTFLSDNITVYPNPFSATTKITTDENFEDTKLLIYNLFGQAVYKKININTNEVIINRDGLTNGMYFYKLKNKKNLIIKTGKLIIE